jgi:hypothetical protein
MCIRDSPLKYGIMIVHNKHTLKESDLIGGY